METNEVRVHDKERALFERIDQTLASYDANAEAVPSYLQMYADELDGMHSQVRALRHP